jgi:hypothetical protein
MSNDFLATTGFALNYSDADLLVQTYYQYPQCQDVQLYLHAISALEVQALKTFSGPATNYQVFVGLDRITVASPSAKILVPYQTAALLSAAFTHGLVTRLILDIYKLNWASISAAHGGPVPLWFDLPLVASPPTGPVPAKPPSAMNADAWTQQYLINLSTGPTGLTNPQTWNQTSTTIKNPNYSACLSYLTDASLQMVGITMGWLAGDTLTANPTDATLTKCRNAVGLCSTASTLRSRLAL